MCNEEFQKELSFKSYLVNKEIIPASFICGASLGDIECIERVKEIVKNDLKWKLDPIDTTKLWIYKYKSIGLIISEMYKLPCDAKESIIGILLGHPAEELDMYLDYVKEHEEELSEYQISNTVYQLYFPERRENVFLSEDDDISDDELESYEEAECEDYYAEVLDKDFVLSRMPNNWTL